LAKYNMVARLRWAGAHNDDDMFLITDSENTE